MPTFNFSLITKGNKRKIQEISKYTVVERNCEGTIINKDNTYKVLYNNNIYSITDESFRTKGRKIVYAKFKDKFGHRIKIIRDKDNRPKVDRRFYSAICDGLICKGKLVKVPFQGILFHIRVCYNPSDVEGTNLALKEWHNYKQKIENGEIDETKEL